MRRSREQKRQAHERILRAAARAFRAGGVERVGIAALMGDAGLTHGGFYAHFASKDALVGEAAVYGLAEAGRTFFEEAAAAAPENPLREILRRYLSRQHRDGPGEGCVIPTLGGEIAREPPDVRHAFSEGLEGYLTQLAEYAPGASAEARCDHALVLLSGMVGAILLARAMDDPTLSDRTLLAARRFFTGVFASGSEPAAGMGAQGSAELSREP